MFSFASPLIRVRRNNGKPELNEILNVQQLDYTREYQCIKEALSNTQKSIEIKFVPGRLEDFCLALTDNPVGLHFSGHGIKSSEKNIGDDWHSFPKDDKELKHCLLFEKADGDTHYVTPRMLSLCKSLKFVFMATCHS